MAYAYRVPLEDTRDHSRQTGAGRRLNLYRDEVIYSEGDPAQYFHIVLEGVVRICKHTQDGRRHILDFKLPGDLFGVTQNAAHSTTAEAVSDALVVVCHRDRLAGADGALIRDRLTSYLSESLFTAEHFLLILGSHDAKERVAAFLLRLAARVGVTPEGRLSLPMGRQDIADHLGLTIETVCRALAALKARRLIVIPNAREVVLADMAALERLVPVC